MRFTIGFLVSDNSVNQELGYRTFVRLRVETSPAVAAQFEFAGEQKRQLCVADLGLRPPTAGIGLTPDIIAANAKRSTGGLARSMSLTVLPERATMPDLQQGFVIDIAE